MHFSCTSQCYIVQALFTSFSSEYLDSMFYSNPYDSAAFDSLIGNSLIVHTANIFKSNRFGGGAFSSCFEKYLYVPRIRCYYYIILLLYVNIINPEISFESLKVDSTNWWDKDYYIVCILS